MGRLSYILGRALRMDFKELFRTVGIVHGITGKSSPVVFADIVGCGLRYGAGFNDYLLCEFYNLTPEQRATYVTRSVNNTLVQMLNDPGCYKYFDYKSAFYRTFKDYIGRDWPVRGHKGRAGGVPPGQGDSHCEAGRRYRRQRGGEAGAKGLLKR